MLQYHGRPENLNPNAYSSSQNNYRRRHGTFALIFRDTEQQDPSKESAVCQLMRSKTLLPRGEKIQINVSGKRYQLTSRQLQKFPKSLLGDPAKRELYRDRENGEIFFDRNRTAFESVFNFYSTRGMLVLPNKSLSWQLVADEMHFFGVYDYLSAGDKKYSLPVPSDLKSKKQVLNGKRIYQKQVWEMCEIPDSSTFARILNLFSLLVILFAVALACVDTLPSMRSSRNSTQNAALYTATNYSMSNKTYTTSYVNSNSTEYFIIKAEQFCIVWFTIEFLARFIVAPEKRKFLLKVLNIVDLAAVLPFYISLIASKNYRVPVYVLKILRLSRIFPVLNISRLSLTMKVVGKTAKACVYDLWTVVFLTFIGTILFGSTVYYCEQWDEGTVFHSIPDACWWAVVTISTLGYGDMVPKTLAGKIVGGVCSVSGVILITPLLPIIYNKFDQFQKLEGNKLTARHRSRASVKLR